MASRRRLATMATVLTISLLAAACGDDKSSSSSSNTSGGGDKPYAGKVVTIFSSIRDIEATRLETAWAAFEAETGIDIQHEGSGAFEADLKVRVDGGNAPDIAFIPQPGLLATLARDGKVVPLEALKADVEANNIGGWVELGSVDGKFYAPPFGANIKSLVWYSPAAFKDKSYEIPTTWDDMMALSQKIVDDGGVPWCVGAGSDQATGWPLTDWVEDAVLRFAGVETYDKWVAHTIPFNDPAILDAIDKVGAIVKNDAFVLNGAQSIPSTTFQDSPLGLLDNSCYMHRQANFIGNQFPEGTTKGSRPRASRFISSATAKRR